MRTHARTVVRSHPAVNAWAGGVGRQPPEPVDVLLDLHALQAVELRRVALELRVEQVPGRGAAVRPGSEVWKDVLWPILTALTSEGSISPPARGVGGGRNNIGAIFKLAGSTQGNW